MGKLLELKVCGNQIKDDIATQEEEAEIPIHRDRPRGRPRYEQNPSEVVDDFIDGVFDLVPLEDDSPDPTAPGPSCLDPLSREQNSEEFVDERVEEDPFPMAGRVIRMDSTLHDRWRALFGYEDADGDRVMDDTPLLEQKFALFASELDWRVARWAVQEGVGHKSLDRLLAIPGVSKSLI